MLLDGASVLITGGTGSFGNAFVRRALALGARRVVVFSRDELKQSEMRRTLGGDGRLRWFIGDVRDRDRLHRAMHGIDVVVHAAALKQVDTAEYNPIEYVRTNVNGSENVVEAAIDCGVRRVVALSTDKASSPINLYGATKLCADRLFVSANHYAAAYPTRFSVVRYGNVMGSRGSVIPFFRKLAAEGAPIPLTDRRMTRFWITLPQAVDFVVDSLEIMQGGELYVPKIPSMRLTDLAEAIAPGSPTVDVGIRPGEKLHEEMIAADDSRRTTDLGDRYVVNPYVGGWGYTAPAGAPVRDGWAFSSDGNDSWLEVEDLRTIIKELDAQAAEAPGRAE